MTFSNAVKKELRTAFGPKWAASAAMWAVIVSGLCVVGVTGVQALQVSETLGNTIANSMY